VSRRARIVLLNGVGSVGKTSIARALQVVVEAPYLHMQMDTFMEMLPDRYQEGPEGFAYEVLHDRDGRPSVAITTGPVGRRALQGMRHAVAAMAGQGNNLILVDVILDGEMDEYVRLLAPFELLTVGVKAPLDVLERRERERGDRMIGLARWQFDRVHRDFAYDLEVDTAVASPVECATLIQRRFGL
jgi:chloramphenicol 3-O phosphotransferase